MAVVGDLVLVADGSGGLAIMRFRVGVRGDANGDGLVNGADLLLIAGSLGTSDPRADLNGNGIVDSVDLAQVGINYRR